MAENMLDVGPPNPKRQKLNSPALSASDGPVDLGSLFDLENDLPDELIPNGGDLSLMGMPSNGSSGMGTMAQDAVAKHKQLSELLRPGSSSSQNAGLNSGSPQPGMGPQQGGPGGLAGLGALTKGIQVSGGSATVPSQVQKQVASPGNQSNAAMGMNAGFNQAMMNSNQAHGLLNQNSQAPGQVMNGSLGSVGRGRGVPGLQYSGQGMQGPAGGGAGPGGAGSVLAETLTQGAPQLGGLPAMNAQQAGGMNKMGLAGSGGPFGQLYGQNAGQQLGATGVNPQLQNKAALSNSLPPFPTDLKGSAVSSVPNLTQMQQQPQQVGMVPNQGVSTGPTADPEKRKLIQQQLVLLLHAHKCQRREQANGEVRQCALPHCRTMKNVLNHMTHCQAGKSCQVAHCASSRQIISHWKNCTRHDCPVCLPLKNASDKRNQQPILNSPSAGLQNSIGTGVTGQQSTSTINSATTIDPSSMQRAYAALGLPYGNQPSAQTQPQVPGQPNAQNQPHQQLRSLNALGTNQMNLGAGGMGVTDQANLLQDSSLPSSLSSSNQLMPDGTAVGSVGNVGNLPTAAPLSASGVRKAWHEHVTQDLRNHLVHKLVQAIFPTPDPAALKDRRMENLVAYARKVEGDMYESANSRDEYYHFLAEKIYKIQKELEEKRRSRLQKHSINQTPMAAQGNQQAGLPQPSALGPAQAVRPPNGPMPISNVPNQHMNRMQVSQGISPC